MVLGMEMESIFMVELSLGIFLATCERTSLNTKLFDICCIYRLIDPKHDRYA